MRAYLLPALCIMLLMAPARAVPCAPDALGDILCGEGASAARVIPDTTSLDKTLAFGWRMKAGKPGPKDNPDPNDVENVLLRLSDGAVLATLGGHSWNLGPVHASLYENYARWAPDMSAVVEAASDKHETYALTYVALSGGNAAAGKAATLDLRAIVEPVTRNKLPRNTRGDFAFRVPYENTVTFGPRDRLRVGVFYRLPGSGMRTTEFDVTLQVSRRDGIPAAKVVSISETRKKK